MRLAVQPRVLCTQRAVCGLHSRRVPAGRAVHRRQRVHPLPEQSAGVHTVPNISPAESPCPAPGRHHHLRVRVHRQHVLRAHTAAVCCATGHAPVPQLRAAGGTELPRRLQGQRYLPARNVRQVQPCPCRGGAHAKRHRHLHGNVCAKLRGPQNQLDRASSLAALHSLHDL